MKEGFEPKLFKSYNLTPEQQVEQDKFLKENIEKGYIRPSQSPIYGITFLLCQKERRKTQTMPRLSIFERLHRQKHLSNTIDFRNHGQVKGSQIFHEIGRQMGIQQCAYQERGRMESSFQNQSRTFRTNGHVFWNV